MTPDTPRPQLPKAYLRLDPNLDQTHPDPGAMVRLLCAAARQPQRGRFRSRAVIVSILGRSATALVVTRHDVTELPDGRWYVEGWDEWQEGDLTVAERQKRIRARRAAGVTGPLFLRDGDVTQPLPGSDETTPKTVRRQDVETLGLRDSLTGALGARVDDEEDDPEEGEALTYLARHGAHIGSAGNGLHRKLIELVARHGMTKLIGTFDRIGRDRTLDARGYIFGASNVLDPIPTAREERVDEEAERSRREVERTQQYLRKLRGEPVAPSEEGVRGA